MKKNWKRVFCIVGIFAVAGMVIAHTIPRNTDASIVNEQDLTDSAEKVLEENELTFQNLELVSTEEDVNGELMATYEDETYRYVLNKDNDTVRMLYMLPEKQEAIQNSEMSVISRKEADDLMYKYMNTLFTEYDTDSLSYIVSENSDNLSEYYQYYIEEITSDTILNRAEIYFSSDGQLTYACGTHNEYFASTFSNSLSEQQAIDRVFTYVVAEKKEIAQLQEKSSLENEDGILISEMSEEKNLTDEDTLIATEDMVLPDGVSVGDEFKPVDTMPDFNFIIESKNDLQISDVKKDATSGTVLWVVECQVDTTWGTYDEIFNYMGVFYVDAATGEIVNVEWTDGNGES